jgi:hypothetical protein
VLHRVKSKTVCQPVDLISGRHAVDRDKTSVNWDGD